jgi:hypothetical protein
LREDEGRVLLSGLVLPIRIGGAIERRELPGMSVLLDNERTHVLIVINRVYASQVFPFKGNFSSVKPIGKLLILIRCQNSFIIRQPGENYLFRVAIDMKNIRISLFINKHNHA